MELRQCFNTIPLSVHSETSGTKGYFAKDTAYGAGSINSSGNPLLLIALRNKSVVPRRDKLIGSADSQNYSVTFDQQSNIWR